MQGKNNKNYLRNYFLSCLALILFWSDSLLLRYFVLGFITSWAFHCTTVDIVYNVTRLVLIYMVAQRLSSAQNLLSGAECFLAKEWCWLKSRAVLTISSKCDVSTVFNVFLLLSISWRRLQGMGDQRKDRRYDFNISLSWTVSFTATLRPFQSLVVLRTSSPGCLRERHSVLMWGAKEDVTPVLPLVRFRYLTFLCLAWNLRNMVEKAVVGETWIQEQQRNLHCSPLQAESQKLTVLT